MGRIMLVGSAVFGLGAAIAGYVWVAFEFPWIIIVPATLGWYAVCRMRFDQATALKAGAVGGVLFTVAFMVSMFLAITDGSPVALPSWLGPIAAAGIAGAVVGAMLGKVKGAGVGGLYSAVGMSAAVVVMALTRDLAPAATQQPGSAQSMWVAAMLLVVGALVGASAGAVVHKIAEQSEAA